MHVLLRVKRCILPNSFTSIPILYNMECLTPSEFTDPSITVWIFYWIFLTLNWHPCCDLIQCLSSAHIIMYLLSQFSLAQFYHNGTGMKKDLEMALELYEVKWKTTIVSMYFVWHFNSVNSFDKVGRLDICMSHQQAKRQKKKKTNQQAKLKQRKSQLGSWSPG